MTQSHTQSTNEDLDRGMQLHRTGCLFEAQRIYQRILQSNPAHPDALHLLGVIAHQTGKNDVAIGLIEKALSIRPKFPKAYNNLGAAHVELKQFEQAIDCYRKAVALLPDFSDSYHNMGNAYKELGKLADAVENYQTALTLDFDCADTHYNLGMAYKDMGKLEDAVVSYQNALSINPNFAEAHNNLGVVFRDLGQLDEAVISYQKALTSQAGFVEAHSNLGNALQDIGKLDDALISYRNALSHKPELYKVHSNLLLAEQYQPEQSAEKLFRLHQDWDARHGQHFRASWANYDNAPVANRRLRVGFVSPDLRRHPVGYFVAGFFKDIDDDLIETVVYSGGQEDDLSDQIKASTSIWRDVRGISDQDLAEMIATDRVDILVDLSGHSAGNRMLVFARKPAPVQVTWAGYVSTTGLKAMDYLLSDRYSTPEEDEKFYSEKIIRMPNGWLCYAPPSYAPEIGPPPFVRNGAVTFACFSNPAKINKDVVAVWARILHELKDSTLVIKYKGIDSKSNVERLRCLFDVEGIDQSRLILQGKSPHRELLARYNEVDIALDPFPYSGGLTTYEALWMGVPVITVPGKTFASRHALSHLSTIGLPELIARDKNNYAEIAVALANDTVRLTGLRRDLRTMMVNSPICDGKRFADDFSAVMRDIWTDWCHSQNHPKKTY